MKIGMFLQTYLVAWGDFKNLIRSTLEEVYFGIRKYLCLVSDRTLGEYV